MGIALITGGTDGVGKATALELARRGFTVVLAARDERKAEAAQKAIVEATGNANVSFVLGDLSSLAKTRALADGFAQRFPWLDVLINNAGVFLPRRSLTHDGLETTFQVNYLAHFLLTQRLRGHLQASAQGRVINLSSSVHTLGAFEPDNLQSERRFSVLGTYASSKLFMRMFTEELAQRLRGTRVTSYAIHPGVVRTPMMLRAPGIFRVMSALSLPFSISSERAARGPVLLATAPELASMSGGYWSRTALSKVRSRFDTEENRARLWALSEALLRNAGA